MSIVSFIIIVILIGVLMWAANKYIPMSSGVKNFLNVAVVVLLVIWLLQLIGVLPVLTDWRIPKVR